MLLYQSITNLVVDAVTSPKYRDGTTCNGWKAKEKANAAVTNQLVLFRFQKPVEAGLPDESYPSGQQNGERSEGEFPFKKMTLYNPQDT
jgi:hypothetical protein